MFGRSGPSVLGFDLHLKRIDHLLEPCNGSSVATRSAFNEFDKRRYFSRVLVAPSRFGTFHSADGPVYVGNSSTSGVFLKSYGKTGCGLCNTTFRLPELSFASANGEVSSSKNPNHLSSFNFHRGFFEKHKKGKPFKMYIECVAQGRTSISKSKEPQDRQDKSQKRVKKEVQCLETTLEKVPPSSTREIKVHQPCVLKAYLFQKQYNLSDHGVFQPFRDGVLSVPEKFHQDSWISLMFWHAFPLYVLWLTLQCPSNLVYYILHACPIRKADYEIYSKNHINFLTGPNSIDGGSRSITKSKTGPFSIFRDSPVRLSLYISDCHEIFATTVSLQMSKLLPYLGVGLNRKLPQVRWRMAIWVWFARIRRNEGPYFISLVGAGYWLQGFRCFPWLAVNFYFKDRLQVDPGTLQFLQTTVNLPFLAKPIYGVISDAIYIRGAHRLPYLIIAGVLQAISWGSILAHPYARSSVRLFTAILTFSNVGAAIAEVANDALVAELGKKKGSIPGELQSFAWLSSAVGSLLGCMLASFVLNKVEFEVIFFIFLVLLVSQLVNYISMNEQSFGLDNKMVSKSEKGKSKLKREEMHRVSVSINLRNQQSEWLNFSKGKRLQTTKLETSTDKNKICKPGPASIRHHIYILFELVKKQEILHPLMWFMGSYAVIPTLGGSLFYYQSEFLKINSSFLGLAKMVGQLGLLAGTLAYNKLLKDIPLRKLVVSVQVLLSVCMLSDLVLVKRVNLQLGIPDEYYVLGASAFVEAISQFKVLPFMVLLAKLCPAGSEGSLFAFFMSCLCLASILSGYFGVALASCLHISSDNFTHLPVGIFIQSMAALLPILWVRYLPDDTKTAITKRKVGKVL